MRMDGKIQTLNYAINDATPHMAAAAAENPNADVLLRAIRFADGAHWHIERATPVSSFRWSNLEASGVTDMGEALALAASELRVPPMSARALPPVLILLSDGAPTDDFDAGLRALMAEPWGAAAVRIAIAIGEDADTDVLQRFIGDPRQRPLRADNPEALVDQIRWVSTALLRSVSQPTIAPEGEAAPLERGGPLVPTAAPGPRVW